jgi:AcrR family transcriptional regulator
MTPKAFTFEKETVLEAAVAVVRARGLEGLSARAVAARLQSSVAPVYKAFRSMDGLTRGVLMAARRMMDGRTRHPYSDMSFLNIGAGIVEFARDENRLFQALFLSRHHNQDILTEFNASVLARMKEDPLLRLMPDASLERLLSSIWLYTLGLATAVVYGQFPDPKTESIVRSLKDMGNILMFAEVAGIGDCESAANDKEWARLIREKGIKLPGSALPPKPPGHPARGRKEKK